MLHSPAMRPQAVKDLSNMTRNRRGQAYKLAIGNRKLEIQTRPLPDTRKSDTLPYNRAFSETEKQLAYEDLRDWMAALEGARELKKIRTPVDPILEVAEITDRVSKTPGGPALLFQNIEAHPGSQVSTNQFGSARRMNLALEVDSL